MREAGAIFGLGRAPLPPVSTCNAMHLWPRGLKRQERPFMCATGPLLKGGGNMIELAKEFLVILAGVLAGERIGRWIDKRFKK